MLVAVLLALATIILAAQLLGAAFRRLGQPSVIGEIIAGIMLGPSLLGWAAPAGSAFLFPEQVLPPLGFIAQLGVVLYMFLVGVELDTSLLRQRTRATFAVSLASIVVPFALGSALALWLHPRFAPAGVPFTAFALFIGIAMSVTAFPVLARILTDQGLHTSRLGTIALACAAVDDVVAWGLLALVEGVVRSEPGSGVPSMASVGLHAPFAAFVLGALMSARPPVRPSAYPSIRRSVVVFMLPVFFAITGLRTQIGLVSGLVPWIACGAIILVATVGKLGGAALAARFAGFPWREALGLGVLMNTRGLMQLIVLGVGLDLGVLSPPLFAMFVLMAIVTTLMTTPVLRQLLIAPEQRR